MPTDRSENWEGKMEEKTKAEKEEDERREAAMAPASPLHPGFKPRRASHEQLSKLQELHKRRLQIKSKIHKRLEAKPHKFLGKGLTSTDGKDLNEQKKDPSPPNSESHSDNIKLGGNQDSVATNLAPTYRRKLHWGLDTKERWERKANM